LLKAGLTGISSALDSLVLRSEALQNSLSAFVINFINRIINSHPVGRAERSMNIPGIQQYLTLPVMLDDSTITETL